ncbi:deoxyguanosinetriphosphate triphosphohydrolase family protein [Halapricum desulfuricans]|uniref:deoxyguanosinetriphosphate triphosphohydrolase family protein n=1 Tax=Halapricum desulfuricans TaxID=2841257 RepID=UPI001E53CB7B|nr:dNTP triphosphohydrolase [Halapricum desulfuricans]
MSQNPPRTKRVEKSPKRDQREPFQRDRDRILYTQAFRRLSGITQVARAEESYTYHDRLSHSLKVAQIGRRIAEYLPDKSASEIRHGLEVDEDVTETAALAHDIGHPPFGHIAEKELDRQVRDRGVEEGFEGNAQSFRIVTNIAPHNDCDRGLNLTLASLNAILKYPWMRGDEGMGENRWGQNEHEKWGVYESERPEFEEARALEPVDKRQSAEAAIMDWADDLAYAVHDMEDFYRSGILPLEQLLSEGTPERQNFLTDVEDELGIPVPEGEDILDWLRNQGGRTLLSPFKGTREERRTLDYVSSTLIQRYIGKEKGGVYLQDHDPSEPYLQIDDELMNEVSLLKHMTVYYVIEDTALRAQQRGQREVIRNLFDILFNAVDPTDGEDTDIVPNPFREVAKDLSPSASNKRICRIVTDTITNMTEKQAIQLHGRLTGRSPGSLQERILY